MTVAALIASVVISHVSGKLSVSGLPRHTETDRCIIQNDTKAFALQSE